MFQLWIAVLLCLGNAVAPGTAGPPAASRVVAPPALPPVLDGATNDREDGLPVAACDGKHPAPLTRTQAMQLAIRLANDKCQATFHRAPFDSTRGPLARAGSDWHWGGLDLGSADGLSAEVRFDAHGEDRSVEIFFATDRPEMLYRQK